MRIALADVERETINNALNFCNGNIPKAAVLLDVLSTVKNRAGNKRKLKHNNTLWALLCFN
ncbi:helix-turn-helix domain-containing protein [Psychromonas sp. MB-3u-54]|uniref:helix-turn-helix domain-containing protein n=1 Tax=Psychromonas sp. MB-3u-54 TaxID=2058319 RepID=UPI0018E37D12